MVENLWAVGAPLRTPLGELTALPQTPNWWGGGLLSPHKPHPALGLRKFGLDFRPFGLGPNEKSWTRLCIIALPDIGVAPECSVGQKKLYNIIIIIR